MLLPRQSLPSGIWPSSIMRLRDVEKLLLYVQLELSDQEILNASLKEAQLNARCWEMEANEVVDRTG